MPKTPEQIVEEFQSRMHEWELRANKLSEEKMDLPRNLDDSEEVSMSEYMSIFREYCASKAVPRGYCYCDPPEYELSTEITVVKKNNKSCTIAVECRSIPLQYFELDLVVENGEWRILRRSCVSKRRGTKIKATL